jgi:hypothetical protein
MTAPSQVDYHDVLRVWREADTILEIEHAWLFDHLMPIDAGFRHIVLGLPAPYPADVARWVTDELISTSA